MTSYKYTAMTGDGGQVTGIIEARDEIEAAQKIKESYPIVLQVTATDEDANTPAFLKMKIGTGEKLNAKAFTLMCNQFAVILRAGIPISRTIQLIAQKMSDKTLKGILKKVAKDVEGGKPLSQSFAERGRKLFPLTFLESVYAGEESGNLDTVFASIAEHYTKQMKLKGKVRGALIYPIFVVVLAIAVVMVLMVKVVPTFIAIFDEQGAELPMLTQSLIAISNFFRTFWWLILGIILIFVISVRMYGKTENGKINLAKINLKLPVLGNINTLSAASQFTNTMAMMLGAGLPMTKAVSITARTMSNYYISKEVGKSVKDLESGITLGKSLSTSKCLPDILIDMTSVGEESGELEHTLGMTAEYYDSELEQATADALAKLEPATLVFIGGLAGYIVIAIYLAMFNMYNGM